MKNKILELSMRILFFLTACASVAAVILICVFLFSSSIPAISEVGLGNFLGGMKWAPNNQPARFGIFPMIIGSIYCHRGGNHRGRTHWAIDCAVHGPLLSAQGIPGA